jgi:hypothetical protein
VRLLAVLLAVLLVGRVVVGRVPRQPLKVQLPEHVVEGAGVHAVSRCRRQVIGRGVVNVPRGADLGPGGGALVAAMPPPTPGLPAAAGVLPAAAVGAARELRAAVLVAGVLRVGHLDGWGVGHGAQWGRFECVLVV